MNKKKNVEFCVNQGVEQQTGKVITGRDDDNSFFVFVLPPLSPRYTVRVLMFVSVWTLVFENEGGELIKKRMRQFAFHFVIVARMRLTCALESL
jgi:hypothetical protein